jgi:hypothetical protein
MSPDRIETLGIHFARSQIELPSRKCVNQAFRWFVGNTDLSVHPVANLDYLTENQVRRIVCLAMSVKTIMKVFCLAELKRGAATGNRGTGKVRWSRLFRCVH